MDEMFMNFPYKKLQLTCEDLSLIHILTRTLLGMTSNTLDKKRYTNGTGQNYYKLYSYITRKARSRAATGPKTRGVNHGVRKETEYGFGFARLGVVQMCIRDSSPG